LATFPELALAWVNRALVWLSDTLLGPLLGLPPLASLLIVSVLTAAAMVPVIGRTSDQKRVVATKRRIRAALLEIRLYNDDPRLVLRAVGHALAHNGIYLRLSLVPLAWLAVPLTLVVAHLQPFFGYDGLTPGVPALVKVETRDAGTQGAQPAGPSLEAPESIRIETGAVRLAARNEVLWRIVPTAVGDYVLTVRVGGQTATKTLHASNRPARRSPQRTSAGLIDEVLYPSEPPLPDDAGMDRIAVTYPEATIDVFGWQVHWLIVYFVLTMASALLIARRLGIAV
jgi:type II secretory pathway pseudopilin PulG